MKNPDNWNLVEFICINCGEPIMAFPSRKRVYCKKCATFRQKEYICQYCQEVFFNKPSDNSKYCSRICFNKDRKGKKYPPEFGQKIRESKLSRKLTNPMSSRRRASKYLYPKPEPCEVCGENDPKKIDRHHIDRDPFNNDRNNIAFLCKLHHQRIHKNWTKRKIIADEYRDCEFCGATFLTKRWSKHRFCSQSCAAKHNKFWLKRSNLKT